MFQTDTIKPYLMSLLVLAVVAFTGCNTTSTDDAQGQLTLQFQSTSGASASPKVNSGSLLANDTLRVSGSNGVLVIDDIRFIVEDFELERADGECENLEGSAEDECEEFEAPPFFVDLPLEGDILNLDTSPIEFGLYEELEFEIDDLELDEEEQDEQQEKQDLIDLVRSEFSDWPDSASMLITGTFVDGQGAETPFRVYAEAEIEIEMEFNPPLEVGENTVNKLLRVNIAPDQWFLRNDGSVIDLSQYDFDETGAVLEFEVEIENGFESIEVEDEDED